MHEGVLYPRRILGPAEVQELKRRWDDHYNGIEDAHPVVILRLGSGKHYWKGAWGLFLIYFRVWHIHEGIFRAAALSLTQIVNGSKARRRTAILSRWRHN